MFDKFFIWCGVYKKPIGYTVGGLNLVASASEYLRYGEMTSTAWIALIVGAFILVDASRS
jgi:hypothetical protein